MYENGFTNVIHLTDWYTKVSSGKTIVYVSGDSLNTSFISLLYFFCLTLCSLNHPFVHATLFFLGFPVGMLTTLMLHMSLMKCVLNSTQ